MTCMNKFVCMAEDFTGRVVHELRQRIQAEKLCQPY